MKSIKILSVCLGLFALASCSNEDMPESRSEFKVTSSIQAVSRTPQLDQNGAGSFQNGDKNSLFFQSKENAFLLAMDYTYGQKYYWPDLGLPAQTTDCKISACYPTVTTDTPANFEWDVRSAETSDLLVAAPVAAKVNTSDNVVLSFSHAMHKLVVELQADGISMQQSDLKTAEISVNKFLPIAVMNLLEGKSVSAKGELSALSAQSDKAAFIIPAQAVGSMTVSVKLGNREASYDLSSCEVSSQPLLNLLSGKSFTLKIKVSKNSFTVVGQEIAGWGNQGESEGTIII